MKPTRFFVSKMLLANRTVIEIQLLGDDNLPLSLAIFPPETPGVNIGDYIVPAAVIEAARCRPLDKGEYVDASGVILPPY